MLPPTVIDCVYILKPPDFYNGSREMNPGAFISVAGALPTEISPQPLPPCGFFFDPQIYSRASQKPAPCYTTDLCALA